MIAVIVQLMVTTFFFNAPGDERYIEVKSIGRDGKEEHSVFSSQEMNSPFLI